jgi:hypothetical protein
MPMAACRHVFREADWLRDQRHPTGSLPDLCERSKRMTRFGLDQRINDRSVQRSAAQWMQDIRWAATLRVRDATSDTERVFNLLADKWRQETSHISSITNLVMHRSYQSIIGMGPAVVPLLLRCLQQRPEHWFWALSAITRHNPVRSEDAGNVSKMTKAWLEWGRQRGQIQDEI